MPDLERRIVVYLDDELSKWLDGKAQEGYKKAAFVRSLMERQWKHEKVVLEQGQQRLEAGVAS